MAPNYIQDLCVPVSAVSTFSALRLVETWLSLVPDNVSETEHSASSVRSCGVEQFAAGHSHHISTMYFQKSAQDSSVLALVSIIN